MWSAPEPRTLHYAVGQVLRAPERAVRAEAENLLALARIQIRDLLAQAQADAERLRQEGFEAGYAAGQREAAPLLAELLARRDTYFTSAERQLVSVVMNAVRQIIDGFDDVTLTQAVVGNALLSVRRKTEATVRVAPSHVVTLLAQAEALRARCPGLLMLKIVGDAALRPGSCVVVSDLGTVSADLETQLAALEAAMSGATEGTA